MECTHCGTINPESSSFCSNCGKPFLTQSSLDPEAVLEQNNPAENIVEATVEEVSTAAEAAENKICPSCGADIDKETVFCSVCGASVSSSESVTTFVEASSTPKKKLDIKKLLLIIGIAIGGLLLIFLIAGLCTNWFGLNGPITQIGAAAIKTVSKYNFSADFEFESDEISVDGTMYFDMDVKKEIINMYLEADNGNSTYIIAIYDDHLIYGEDDYLECTDISYQISSVCDALDKSKDLSFTYNEAWDTLIDAIPNKQQEEINDDYVNLKTLKKLVKTFFTGKLNNATWLKKNAGYSTSLEKGVKIHTFEPDIHEFLTACGEHFEDAFVKASVYNDFTDLIDETEDFSDEFDISISFGIKGGKLVLIEGEVDIDGEAYAAKCEFYDIGKTQPDEDMLDDLLDDADMNS